MFGRNFAIFGSETSARKFIPVKTVFASGIFTPEWTRLNFIDLFLVVTRIFVHIIVGHLDIPVVRPHWIQIIP